MALTDNLTAYYKMNDDALTTDSSGNDNTLTNNGSVPDYSGGLIDYCADFGTTNTTKFFKITEDLGVSSGACSFQCWFKLRTDFATGNETSYAGIQTFVFGMTQTTDVYYHLTYRAQGDPGIWFTRDAFSVATVEAIDHTGLLGTSNWYHIVGVHEATGLMKVFVNGSKTEGGSNSASGTSNAYATECIIGGLGTAWNNAGETNCAKCKAYVDEVAYWSRALTDAEVSTLYNSGAGYELSFESASISPSVSPSVSSSVSPSASISPSKSASVSPSSSVSPSVSASVSPSVSSSVSASLSPSISPSPSPDWKGYTRGNYAVLPADDTDLENIYTETDYTNASSDNNVWVEQPASGEYSIHQFKDYVSVGNATFTWKGKSSLAPTTSAVYLQIYNQNTNEWEQLDVDNTSSVDTNFTLTSSVADLTNYKNGGVVSCRVYQGA